MSEKGSTQPPLKFIPTDPEVSIPKLFTMDLSCPNGLKAQGVGEMTPYEVLFINRSVGWNLVLACLPRIAAAGMKVTPRGRVQRRRHVTLEPDSTSFVMRVWHRDRRHQSLRIGVFGVQE